MDAIKIHIDDATFLLPESHDDYIFPTYIIEHKEMIRKHIEASKKWKDDPMGLSGYHIGLPDLSEFKRVTGIIGWPIDMRDVTLYQIDKGINVVLEMTL